mmetsp:Transcript_837/g.698  ORF Transcript_837/g.698 Transcript_837/m.698 type:complete len:130 (-) Transcript_837:243-632(-)
MDMSVITDSFSNSSDDNKYCGEDGGSNTDCRDDTYLAHTGQPRQWCYDAHKYENPRNPSEGRDKIRHCVTHEDDHQRTDAEYSAIEANAYRNLPRKAETSPPDSLIRFKPDTFWVHVHTPPQQAHHKVC